MSKRIIFAISCATTFVLALGLFAVRNHPSEPIFTPMGNGIFVTGQITTREVDELAQGSFGTIIDLRPDGEASDQTPSAEIGARVTARGMAFHYIPVPHGEIPAETVTSFASVLLDARKPVLLYCRSGNRAVRTCALALATDPHGPGADDILAMARSTGHPVDDLRPAITDRIAARITDTTAPK